MGMKQVANRAPVIITAPVIAAASIVDAPVFVADRDYELLEVRETHSVAGAASSTLQIRHAASGTAPASGTALLNAALALDSTANTPVRGTLTTTLADLQIARGRSIALDFTGTVTAYVGVVQLVLQPTRQNVQHSW